MAEQSQMPRSPHFCQIIPNATFPRIFYFRRYFYRRYYWSADLSSLRCSQGSRCLERIRLGVARRAPADITGCPISTAKTNTYISHRLSAGEPVCFRRVVLIGYRIYHTPLPLNSPLIYDPEYRGESFSNNINNVFPWEHGHHKQ